MYDVRAAASHRTARISFLVGYIAICGGGTSGERMKKQNQEARGEEVKNAMASCSLKRIAV
jgi:hypothetical protein